MLDEIIKEPEPTCRWWKTDIKKPIKLTEEIKIELRKLYNSFEKGGRNNA